MGNDADKRRLKSTLATVLMIPVIVLLGVAAYIASGDFMAGLPLLGVGVGIGLFNLFVLKVQFAKLDNDEDGSQ